MLGSGAAGAGDAWSAGTVQVDGGYLAFHRTGGDGPSLVLSHGLTDNGLCWSRFATVMAADFDVIMLDARGHGESSRIGKTDPRDPALDIAQAIEALALDRPVVMGHSVGARATAAYANAYPDRVSKVILEDPPLLPVASPSAAEARRDRFRQQVESFRNMSEAAIVARGRATSPDWHEDEFPAWAAAKKQVDPMALPTYSAPWQDTIARILVPTLLIYGEGDRGGIVTPAIAAEAHETNPNLSSVQISGAGHNIRRENFPDFLAAVLAFLKLSPR
jgi:pimeloyl-ACP methyl ester carboxylesterase